VLVAASWFAVLIFGLKPGIDLAGGTEWKISYDDGKEAVLRFAESGDAVKEKYAGEIEKEYGRFETLSFSRIGPVVGRDLLRRSVWALAGVCLAIALFVAWAFRNVSFRISSWQYGAAALIALFHDVSIPLGMLAVLGKFGGWMVGTTVIVALLFVLGYSVNDTIVVADRMREHLIEEKSRKTPIGEVINRSVKETLARSLNTSMTLIITAAALLAAGPASLAPFLTVILVGTAAGTYSSIFVAMPLLYLWNRKCNG